MKGKRLKRPVSSIGRVNGHARVGLIFPYDVMYQVIDI